MYRAIALMTGAVLLSMSTCSPSDPPATQAPTTTAIVATADPPTIVPTIDPASLDTAVRLTVPRDDVPLDVAHDTSPPSTNPPCENPDGVWCLPFAPDGLTGCDEMNFYRIEFGLPDRFGDQPRTGRRSQWGIGWRESNCNNAAKPTVKAARCCVGYWAIAVSNIHGTGYSYGAMMCGVAHRWDIYGNLPIQKQKQACFARVLFDWWQDHPGTPDPWRL